MTESQPPHVLVTPEVEQGIIEAYGAGTKLLDIEQAYGVARATVYWVLDKNGITPDRIKKASRMVGGEAALSHLYAIIESQDAYIRRMETQLRELGVEPE